MRQNKAVPNICRAFFGWHTAKELLVVCARDISHGKLWAHGKYAVSRSESREATGAAAPQVYLHIDLAMDWGFSYSASLGRDSA